MYTRYILIFLGVVRMVSFYRCLTWKYATQSLVLSALLSTISLSAEALTLQEALVKAYENNFGLKIAVEEGKITDQQQVKALSGAMPKVRWEGRRARVRTKTTTPDIRLPGEQKGIAEDHSITVTQSLFSGGQTYNNLRQADFAVKASHATYNSKEQSLMYEATSAYITVLESKEVLELRKHSVDSLTRQVQSADQRFALGDLTLTDVSQAKANLASAEASMASASSELATAEAKFRNMFGIDPTALAQPDALHDLPQSYQELQGLALSNNPHIRAAEMEQKSAHHATNSSKGVLLPSLDFQGTIHHADQGASLMAYDTIDKRAMLQLTVPIFQGGAEYANIREAQHAERVKILKRDAMLTAVESQASQVWYALEAARISLPLNDAAVSSAKIALDSINEEFKQGARTLLDVLTIEQKFYEAELGKTRANYQYILSTYAVHLVAGRLTATDLKLPATYYKPEVNSQKTRFQVIGFALD
jgi:outer membrane protein